MLTGPPGVGKTMLAQRLPGVLPPLTESESLEVTAIHSAAGLLPPERPLIEVPPFIAPHHTASVSALVGGGNGVAKPGAVSRAHRGVLFLDGSVNGEGHHRQIHIVPTRWARTNGTSGMATPRTVRSPRAWVQAES